MTKVPGGRLIAAALLAVVAASSLAAQTAPLTVHEWGTFTALQDDSGTALGAINTDDEPVPDFVCTINGLRIPSARSQLSPVFNKGVTGCHPGVTMRLETPVIYFYPSDKQKSAPIDVSVAFRGGWLTEFYPRAVATAPDLVNARSYYPSLTSETRSSLTWKNLELNAPGNPVVTDDPVWTAPREVAKAAVVKVPGPTTSENDPDNHSEKFLFYRGVGHLNSPLRVVRNPNSDRLSLYADLSALDAPASKAALPDLRVPAAWLIEIRPQDGFCAFRAVSGGLDLNTGAGQALASLPASFTAAEFSSGRLPELRAAMWEALIAAGLFPDEAAAMLKTWELSYFKSPGRRLFYVTPRGWTDRVLPLSIEGAKITRAMIGRIELITPAQRELLSRIEAGPCPDMMEFERNYQIVISAAAQAWSRHANAGVRAVWKQPTLAELNIPLPAIYQDYVDLGRFRDALVLNEQQIRPTSALSEFIAANALQFR